MAKKKEVMSLERMKEIWLSPYQFGKKPDYSQIYPHYHPNMRFKDSIQEVNGKAKFVELCDRLQKRCSEIRLDIHDMAQNDKIFFVQWTMSIRFRGTPLTPMYGATKITIDDEGLITEHRDYYDLWGDTLDVIPIVGRMYRWFMVNVMG